MTSGILVAADSALGVSLTPASLAVRRQNQYLDKLDHLAAEPPGYDHQ
jgi:hypothetical protein